MNLLTPLAGFLIGYGGIMGYQVIDSTYKGEMPGPKSFGYFIGGMTLLSAATIYALGRTDKVFNAGGLSQFTPEELTQSSAIHGDFDHASLNYSGHQNMILRADGNYNDFIEDMEGVMGKYGEMKDFDSGYNPKNNLLKARMVVEVDDEDFGDVDFDAETMMPEKQCVICGAPYIGYGHNPEPIFPMSRGRCCDVCNATVVIPYRMGGMNFRFGEDFEAQGRDVMGRFVKWDCDLCGGRDEVGYVDEEREFKVCEHCDVDGADYDPKLWEAQSARKSRYNLNRFTKPKRANRTGVGVKRKFWKDLLGKSAEDMPDELDVVLAQLYEIEDMKNPTPEDLTNYQNLLTRYYEIVSFNAEQQMKGRVRTMSGKPHVPRKLKKDKDISPEDAAKKVKFESPQNAYLLAYNQGFDDGRSQRRVSRTIFAPDKSYSEDEKLFEETFRRIK